MNVYFVFYRHELLRRFLHLWIEKKNFERAQLALKVLVEINGIDDSFPRESPCCNAFSENVM